MSSSFDPESLDLPQGHFIGGAYRPMPEVTTLCRPSDGRAFAGCPIADADLVDEAVSVAENALKSSGWGRCQPRDRTRALQRWADLIEAEAEPLAQLEAVASTRPIRNLVAGTLRSPPNRSASLRKWPTRRAAIWCRRTATSLA